MYMYKVKNYRDVLKIDNSEAGMAPQTSLILTVL